MMKDSFLIAIDLNALWISWKQVEIKIAQNFIIFYLFIDFLNFINLIL